MCDFFALSAKLKIFKQTRPVIDLCLLQSFDNFLHQQQIRSFCFTRVANGDKHYNPTRIAGKQKKFQSVAVGDEQ